MEDEGGKTGDTDAWVVPKERRQNDVDVIVNDSSDAKVDTDSTEGNKEDRYDQPLDEELTNKSTVGSSSIVFKGFKKRILDQTRANQSAVSRSTVQELSTSHVDVSAGRGVRDKRSDKKRGKIAEYAQYLGLQPAGNYKCSKCFVATFCSVSTLKQHQRACSGAMTPIQGTPSAPETSPVPLASNFRITRKVYLCSACGTYFENWNLFLHMREVHKRHICLFCLGMFGQAERLSYHLSSKHNVPETKFSSVEDFYTAFKGSCYLMCCNCEKVFSETDNFYNHYCSNTQKQHVPSKTCPMCKQQAGSHLLTCGLVSEKSNKVANSAVRDSSLHPSLPHAVPTTVQPLVSNTKPVAKRGIKNNRAKHDEESSPGSETPVQLDVTRDTVAETIMEVSRYVGEDSNGGKDKDSWQDRVSDLAASPAQSAEGDTLDSVSKTIMEVSRCVNDGSGENIDADAGAVDADEIPIQDPDRKTEEQSEQLLEEPENRKEGTKAGESSSTLVPDEIKESLEAQTERTSVPNEAEMDSESSVYSSPPNSPFERSLFSPEREGQIPESQAKELPANEAGETPQEVVAAPSEPRSSVSFNAVATSDRSLIIKIRTNRNSEFSVTTVNGHGGDDHDGCRDSEENNNADGSTSEEKASNLSDHEGESISGYRMNDEDDSDSDSEKLAVVDSNADEAEREDEAVVGDVDLARTDGGATEEKNEAQDEAHAEEIGQDVLSSMQDEDAAKPTEEKALESDGIVLAGEDVPSLDLNVEGILESIELEDLLKRCIDVASPTCVYCNHARHIAVNGKQLALHVLAEHRFQPQHPAIIIHREQFIARVKKSIDDLDAYYFNLDSYDSVRSTYNVPEVRTYECFHCRFHSVVHKELYLHNRKMHQKTILICIMCKSTFYSYSELLCHLCPGIYSPNINVRYRCCLCSIGSLPSAFRLMVHLRKRHHACDVCLEPTGNQQRLSNHVWKHKLHHLCYRCGIAYRNKPDITKHLFWKHGTESVLCKKCLQKKWPHIYHFCIPPTAFVCEECGSSFTRAVALKVHKRLHSGDAPHACDKCTERLVSKKLLVRHREGHDEPTASKTDNQNGVNRQSPMEESRTDHTNIVTNGDDKTEVLNSAKDLKEPAKKVVDVYDLPPLNLSSDSDSDTADEKEECKGSHNVEETKIDELPTERVAPPVENQQEHPAEANDSTVEVEQNDEEKEEEAQIIDGIWDNFKTYAASLEKQDPVADMLPKENDAELEFLRRVILADHDYCVVSEKDGSKSCNEDGTTKEDENGRGAEHDYTGKSGKSPSGRAGQNECSENDATAKKKSKTPKKKKKQSGSTSSSESSSDSDSSSCSCGSNCSCSSSSSGSSSSSSSSSDSDSSASENSPKKQQNRKERKREKENSRRSKPTELEGKGSPPLQVENGGTDACEAATSRPAVQLRESDLETEETETDEDFYDEHPQQLANKLLAEKRNQLMLLAAVAPASVDTVPAPLNNGVASTDSATHSPDPAAAHAPTPTTPENAPKIIQSRKRTKTKKRKRGDKPKQGNSTPTVESIKLNIPKSFYQRRPFASSSPAMVTVVSNSRSSTPNLTLPASERGAAALHSDVQQVKPTDRSVGSGSETENKRSSKRKRVPKRFYGDSSDEDTETSRPPTLKWRKLEPPAFASGPTSKQLTFSVKQHDAYGDVPDQQHQHSVVVSTPTVAASASDTDEPPESSSDSSDEEEASLPAPQPQPTRIPQTIGNAPLPERSDNVYCYCRCPYDEVSEMIACDGEDCRIEWFHFECVGIMVPPKGKWYCPDCRKKHGVLETGEDYLD
ncbi:uncharacterized protein LOC105698303 isoform X2 [Orussus abietinus]|uniref:uncharacterized protein LOC105698303 isoform X2 n=1 Tax=Orussus abietinus TaxID=222816 RepID=UPI000625C764|nr:uncharacterized protein LOC105698303 isoform X2 [Orussus abietinus]